MPINRDVPDNSPVNCDSNKKTESCSVEAVGDSKNCDIEKLATTERRTNSKTSKKLATTDKMSKKTDSKKLKNTITKTKEKTTWKKTDSKTSKKAKKEINEKATEKTNTKKTVQNVSNEEVESCKRKRGRPRKDRMQESNGTQEKLELKQTKLNFVKTTIQD